MQYFYNSSTVLLCLKSCDALVNNYIDVEQALIREQTAVGASGNIFQFRTNISFVIQPARIIFRKQLLEKIYHVREAPTFYKKTI